MHTHHPTARWTLRVKTRTESFVLIVSASGATTFTPIIYLKKADNKQQQAVGTNTTSEHFVQFPLYQELLQHEHQVRQLRIGLHISLQHT